MSSRGLMFFLIEEPTYNDRGQRGECGESVDFDAFPPQCLTPLRNVSRLRDAACALGAGREIFLFFLSGASNITKYLGDASLNRDVDHHFGYTQLK